MSCVKNILRPTNIYFYTGLFQNIQQIYQVVRLKGQTTQVRRYGGDKFQHAFGGPYGKKEIKGF